MEKASRQRGADGILDVCGNNLRKHYIPAGAVDPSYMDIWSIFKGYK